MARSSRRKKSAAKQQFVAGIISLIMKLFFLVGRTLRFPNKPEIPKGAVVAIYHEEIFPVSFAYAGKDTVGLASGNHFGHAISKVFKSMGSDCVLGSSSKDGNQAVFELIQIVKDNRRVVIAVDGPRGPRREWKPGAVMIAAKAKAPLYILRAKAKGKRLNTWDKFLYPRPFAKVEFALEHYDINQIDPETGKRKSIKTMIAEAELIMDKLLD